jgi:hypothetical protein
MKSRKDKISKEPAMLTVKEVAERIDAGASSVRKWAVRGLFPGARFVSESIVPYWQIPETALDGFIKPTQGRKPKLKKSL